MGWTPASNTARFWWEISWQISSALTPATDGYGKTNVMKKLEADTKRTGEIIKVLASQC